MQKNRLRSIVQVTRTHDEGSIAEQQPKRKRIHRQVRNQSQPLHRFQYSKISVVFNFRCGNLRLNF